MNEQIEAMKRALDAQILAEHEAGYVIVRSPLPDDGTGGCHSCGAPNVADFAPIFERDPSVMQSYMHIAVVCGVCKASEAEMQKLGDRIVAHGKQLFERYGDAVVVTRQPVPRG